MRRDGTPPRRARNGRLWTIRSTLVTKDRLRLPLPLSTCTSDFSARRRPEEALEPGVRREPAAVSPLRLDRALGALARRGDPVLLDDNPAVVAVELREEAGEVDVAGAEVAEDAAARGALEVGRRVQHVEADVLQVDVV